MPGDVTDAGDDTRAGESAPFLIHAVCRPETDLEKSTGRVDQSGNALADEEPAELVLALLSGLAPAFTELGFLLRDLVAAVN
jgi:hypothetical protein